MKHETIRACSIWRALEVVGDVPVLLILEQAFLGRKRFAEFVSDTGVARSVIAHRLGKLVDAGVFAKPAKPRAGYRLTRMGRELFPMALTILRWQHLWEADERGYRVELIHAGCGKTTTPVPACSHCCGKIDPRAVSWAAGPGLSQVSPVYGRRRLQTAAASAKRGGRMMVDSVIELFGDRWATLVIRACFTGVHRFDEILRDTAMSTNILADRLDRLLSQGIIRAVPYSAHQDRFEYRLTEKGRALYPVLLSLLHWGDAWFADAKGPPLILTHKPCDHPLEMVVACDFCADPLEIGALSFRVTRPPANV